MIEFYRVRDKWGEFSNFAPTSIQLENKIWPTTEHYFQAKKFLSEELQEQIRNLKTPREAADMGRDRNLPLREDRESVKDDIMKVAVQAKFKQYSDLAVLLLSTNNEELVENSPYDSYWGCGKDKKGKNMLGKILMEVREELEK